MTFERRSEPRLLSVRDLRIAFGGREAVRGISFDVASGETLGLVGESGSGKSATALAVMRLLGPSASVGGSIILRTHVLKSEGHGAPGLAAGKELLALPEEAMRRHRGRDVAMVFQEPMTALNPVMTVGRQIAEALEAHAPRMSRKEVRARVMEAMHEVGLPERANDYPHQFSGGQRQRVVIAMALMNRPQLLIADEPTTALDVTVQAQVLALLKRLRSERGLSMLFISHDLAVVGQVADRVAVMQNGVIVEMGEVPQVLTAPRHAYTRQLLNAAPTMQTDRERELAV
jgi:peptide/nickel transport system ATP-binding protein